MERLLAQNGEWTGKDLGENLARFLQSRDWMVWTELPLGSVMWDRPGRADVCAVLKSFSNVRVHIYEVKISRGDFLADVAQGKYRRYFDDCTGLYFATPAKLITKQEVPEGCGLMTLGEKGWRAIVPAPRREFKWSQQLLLKLLMKGYEDYFPKMRQLDRQRFEDDHELRGIARGKGAELARKLADAERYIQTAEEQRQKIEEALGRTNRRLEDGIYSMKREIDQLLSKRRYAAEAIQLASLTMRLFNGDVWRDDHYAQQLRAIADRMEGNKDREIDDKGE